ncbi:MAG: hypothetical protein ACYC7J_07435 [Syntrophales bacterium]
MTEEQSFATAREIMLGFAEATGLTKQSLPPRRYLWTDSFAVCTFLELHRQGNDRMWLDLSLRLVEQVHAVLGRHRPEDRRSGWISGLAEQEGALHPTAGGLRIGKGMNERGPAEPFDERQEWDRDGQYYHYLTKWMHALGRVGRVTGEGRYTRWAIELAKAAHRGFTYLPAHSSGRKRMYWKMSIDLSRPLVPSMGHHDPLDGLITFCALQAARPGPAPAAGLDLGAEIADLRAMCAGIDWTTDDPLGLGGLLCDAFRMGQLIRDGSFPEEPLLGEILAASAAGMDALCAKSPFTLPAQYRLAFREFGLSIGLKAVDRLRSLIEAHPERFSGRRRPAAAMAALREYRRLGAMIEAFWLEPANRKGGSWLDHQDINGVMLATSLAPDGFLSL